MRTLRKLDIVTSGLMTIGAVNWGVASLTQHDALGGAQIKRSPLARAVYGLVGMSAIYKLVRLAAPKTKHERRQAALERTMTKLEAIHDKLDAIASQTQDGVKHGKRQFESYRKQVADLPKRPAWL